MKVSDFLAYCLQSDLVNDFKCEVIKGDAVLLELSCFRRPNSSNPLPTVQPRLWYVTRIEERFKLINYGDDWISKNFLMDDSKLYEIPDNRVCDVSEKRTGFYIRFIPGCRNHSSWSCPYPWIDSPLENNEEKEILDRTILEEKELTESVQAIMPNPKLHFYG